MNRNVTLLLVLILLLALGGMVLASRGATDDDGNSFEDVIEKEGQNSLNELAALQAIQDREKRLKACRKTCKVGLFGNLKKKRRCQEECEKKFRPLELDAQNDGTLRI